MTAPQGGRHDRRIRKPIWQRRAEARGLGRGLAELEFVKSNFDDPRHEWRRLFAEVLGTFFFLVLVGAGAASLTP